MSNKNAVDNICWWIPFKKLRTSIRTILEKNSIILEKLYYQQLRIEKSNNIISDMILFKDKKKVFYLQAPEHGNIGDHAILYASQKLINNYYPNTIILEYSYDDFYYIFDYIKKFITDEDIIFLPGGGNLGNLYINEEDMRRNIIKQFSKNKIFIFPASIHYSNDEEGNNQLLLSKEIYNQNNNLHIMTRDENSYNFAIKHFVNNKIYLVPDIALYLEDEFQFNNKQKDGVLFILRNDKEKISDNKIINTIKEYLNSINIQYDFYDTYLGNDKKIFKYDRKDYIYSIINKISNYKLCITDRFHGIIFSYIANTPLIVFKSLDSKIEYGIKWFENMHGIYYAQNKDTESIKMIIDEYLKYDFNIKNGNFMKKINDVLLQILL